jgi:demethylmenaquinone methyltransferase/2-methoxy-6-polyprenyl-1,4-benzoquinol methylase
MLAVGGDFTPEMMRVGRGREGSQRVQWLRTDALDLPFPEASFDAVISGYLLRNVSDVRRALMEQCRVLKPGGTLVCLDTTPLPGDIWHLPARLYLRVIIPIIGGVIAGEGEAYSYLPESTRCFMSAEELAECMLSAGFREVRFRRFMGGTMAIHWGSKKARY